MRSIHYHMSEKFQLEKFVKAEKQQEKEQQKGKKGSTLHGDDMKIAKHFLLQTKLFNMCHFCNIFFASWTHSSSLTMF